MSKGFGALTCPMCGESTNTIVMDLSEPLFRCGECEKEFDVGDVENLIQQWKKVLDWVATMPEKA